MSKSKVDIMEGRMFSANLSFSKAFLISLIGWIKAGPSKGPLLLWTCKQALFQQNNF